MKEKHDIMRDQSEKDMILGETIIRRIAVIIFEINLLIEIAEKLDFHFEYITASQSEPFSDLGIYYSRESKKEIFADIGYQFRCQGDIFNRLRGNFLRDFDEGMAGYDIAEKSWDIQEELKATMHSKKAMHEILKDGAWEKRIFELYHSRREFLIEEEKAKTMGRDISLKEFEHFHGMDESEKAE